MSARRVSVKSDCTFGAANEAKMGIPHIEADIDIAHIICEGKGQLSLCPSVCPRIESIQISVLVSVCNIDSWTLHLPNVTKAALWIRMLERVSFPNLRSLTIQGSCKQMDLKRLLPKFPLLTKLSLAKPVGNIDLEKFASIRELSVVCDGDKCVITPPAQLSMLHVKGSLNNVTALPRSLTALYLEGAGLIGRLPLNLRILSLIGEDIELSKTFRFPERLRCIRFCSKSVADAWKLARSSKTKSVVHRPMGHAANIPPRRRAILA